MLLFVMVVVNTYSNEPRKAKILRSNVESQVKVTRKVIKCKKIKCHNFNSKTNGETPIRLQYPVTKIFPENLCISLVNRLQGVLLFTIVDHWPKQLRKNRAWQINEINWIKAEHNGFWQCIFIVINPINPNNPLRKMCYLAQGSTDCGRKQKNELQHFVLVGHPKGPPS